MRLERMTFQKEILVKAKGKKNIYITENRYLIKRQYCT